MAYLFLAYYNKYKYCKLFFFIELSQIIHTIHSLSSLHYSQPPVPTSFLFPRSMAHPFPFQKEEAPRNIINQIWHAIRVGTNLGVQPNRSKRVLNSGKIVRDSSSTVRSHTKKSKLKEPQHVCRGLAAYPCTFHGCRFTL